MTNLIDADYFNQQMTTLGLKAAFTPLPDALDILITDASDWVENYCDRQLDSASVVDVVRGKDRNRIIVNQFPVTAVATISFEPDTGSAALTVDPANVRILSSGILEFKSPLNGPWRSDGTYTITYTAGYSTIPANVKRATALKVADLMRPQYQGPTDREVNMVSNLEEQILDLLEYYRRERIG